MKKRILAILTIILGLGISLGAIYFMYYRQDLRRNSLSTGIIDIDFNETSDVILRSNVPVIDDLGLKSAPYEFTIKNKSQVPVEVEIKLDIDNSNTINLGAVRYGLFINGEKVKKDYIHNDNLILYTYNNMQVGETIECKIYFWIDYYYDRPGEIFKAKIKVEGKNVDVIYKEATFLSGYEFNVKIKELAGTDTSVCAPYYHNCQDSNIININKATTIPQNFTPTEDNILSTSDSEVPIYGWFDKGTLYYYSEASKLYTNYSAFSMFRALKNVESIDLRGIDTSKTYTMGSMFFWCINLKKIDLSNFNTSNVTRISEMFNMYEDNKLLTSLDLSSLDMSKVENAENMITHMPALKQLKTPKVIPSGITINLPKTMYDSSNNAYTTLDSTTPTETWLTDSIS